MFKAANGSNLLWGFGDVRQEIKCAAATEYTYCYSCYGCYGCYGCYSCYTFYICYTHYVVRIQAMTADTYVADGGNTPVL